MVASMFSPSTRTNVRRPVGAIALPIPAAGDGGQHDDLVAVAELGVQTAEEADVLVVDVDVDEPAQVAVLDQPVLDAGVVGLQVVDERGQRRALGRRRPSGRRCSCAGWWGCGPRRPWCSSVSAGYRGEVGDDGDLFLGHLAVDDPVGPELDGTLVIPVLARADQHVVRVRARSRGRCRCGSGRPRWPCASGRRRRVPRRAPTSPCRARAARWSRTRRTSGCPAALTISTSRSARSLPSGPATMPHASSGWSRLACATMASYVAWSMVSMLGQAYGRAVRRTKPRGLLPGQRVGDPLPHRLRSCRASRRRGTSARRRDSSSATCASPET